MDLAEGVAARGALTFVAGPPIIAGDMPTSGYRMKARRPQRKTPWTPGDGPVPDDVLDSIVGAIREQVGVRDLGWAVEVGGIIVNRLIGSLEKVRARGPKDESIARLAERGDLNLSKDVLYAACRVWELDQRLEVVGTFQHLSFAHCRAVLRAPDDSQKELLLTADAAKWSVRQLRAAVAELPGRERRGGRAPRPKTVKLAHQMLTLARSLEEVSKQDVVALTSDQRREADDDLGRARLAIEAVRELLQKVDGQDGVGEVSEQV